MKRDFRCRLYIMCLLVVFVVGCKVKRPDGVLPETTMENLLYDYHIAKTMSDNLPYNESYKKYCIQMLYSANMVQRKLFSIRLWYGIPVTRKYWPKSMKELAKG